MTWTVVRGKFKQGTIELLDRAVTYEGAEVLVLLPEYDRPVRKGAVWKLIKQEIARKNPELLDMSLEARQSQFEQLSATIAEHMPYHSLEEFERAMRGDEYGLARH